MIEPTRRRFITGLAGILISGLAPAIITRPGLLMPGRGIIIPSPFEVIWGMDLAKEGDVPTAYIISILDPECSMLKIYKSLGIPMQAWEKQRVLITGAKP